MHTRAGCIAHQKLFYFKRNGYETKFRSYTFKRRKKRKKMNGLDGNSEVTVTDVQRIPPRLSKRIVDVT